MARCAVPGLRSSARNGAVAFTPLDALVPPSLCPFACYYKIHLTVIGHNIRAGEATLEQRLAATALQLRMVELELALFLGLNLICFFWVSPLCLLLMVAGIPVGINP